MPSIGLGCWSGVTKEEQESCKSWVLSALKVGYRHLDTAYDYGTEAPVGQAIRESGIPREEIFVTTKLPMTHHKDVAKSLEESLARFGYDYYDLYLMHWPQAALNDNGKYAKDKDGYYQLDHSVTFNETWADMEKLLETGKVKAIGVSNFSVKTLQELLKTAKVVPAVNQVEMHPHQAQPDLLEFTKEKGIILTAYSPTGYENVRDDPTVAQLASKYGTSPAQLSLAWHIARGTTAVPKSTNEARQKANLLELPKLDGEDVKLLTSLHKDAHLCPYPGPKEKDGQPIIFGWTFEQMGW